MACETGKAWRNESSLKRTLEIKTGQGVVGGGKFDFLKKKIIDHNKLCFIFKKCYVIQKEDLVCELMAFRVTLMLQAFYGPMI